MSWVWSSSKSQGIDRLVLLAIADAANDEGNQAWPSIATLKAKTGLSERTVQRSITSLVELGELAVQRNAGRKGVNVYSVTMTPPSESHPGAVTPRQADTPSERRLTPVSVTPSPRQADTRTVLEPSKNRPGPRKRGTRIPEDFKPTPADIAWQREKGLSDALARRETEKFVNYWQAKSGSNAVKLDWSRTWRNWMLEALDRAPRERSAPAADTNWMTVGAR
jgi:hypothetical protein